MFSFCAIIIFLLWKLDPDTRMVLVSRLRDRQRVASFCNLVILLVSTVGFSWKVENHWDDQRVCDVDKKMFLILMRIRWFVVCFLLCWLDYWLTWKLSIYSGIYMPLYRLSNAARRWHECIYTAITNALCPNQT